MLEFILFIIVTLSLRKCYVFSQLSKFLVCDFDDEKVKIDDGFRALVGEGDEEGIKNILLCRVILGKPEQIVTGSKQSYPSSNQFDSGVDNLENPRKYVIWSCNMNSYILPTYIVSFKSHLLRGNNNIQLLQDSVFCGYEGEINVGVFLFFRSNWKSKVTMC